MKLATLLRTPLFLVGISFILMMIDGYDMLIMAFVAPLVVGDLHLGSADIGAVFAAGLAGSAVGGLVLGPLADRFGRRTILIASLMLAGIATLVCSQANSVGAFIVIRLLTGFALGGVLTTAIPLAAEHFPQESRSRAVTCMFIGYPLGAVIGGAVTATLISYGWRSLFVGTGILALLMVPVAFLMQETLMSRTSIHQGGRVRRRRLSIVELFTEGRLWPTLTTALGIFSVLLLAYLLNSWTPLIAVRLGFNPRMAALCGVFLNLGGVVGALCSTVFVRRLGIFKLAAIMVGVGSVAVVCIGVAASSPISLFLVLFISGLLVIGAQQNLPAMSVHLYPQRMRAAGTGWQFAAGRVGSILGPLIGGSLLSSGLTYVTLFFVMAIPALLAGCSFAVVHHLQSTALPGSPAAAQALPKGNRP